jgi:hypothetical protein
MHPSYITFRKEMRSNILQMISVCALLILLTSTSIVTTIESFGVTLYIRYASLLIVMGSIFYKLIANPRYTKLDVRSVVILLFMVIYGVGASLMSFGNMDIDGNLFIDVMLIFIGLMVLIENYRVENKFFPDWVPQFVVLYAIGVLVMTYASGGILLDFPPTFVYSYYTEVTGLVTEYSLGMTNFLGFSALSSVYVFESNQQKSTKLFWLFSSFLLIYMTILAGGRGEVVASIFLMIVIVMSNKKLSEILWVLLALLFIGLPVFVSILMSLQDAAVVQRFIDLREGDLSMRDVLISDAIGILDSNSQCLFVGCGWEAFQKFMGYEFGLYPHNSLLELVVSFGVIFTFLMIVFVIIGLVKYKKNQGRIDFFMISFMYFLLISFKSGYFIGSWLLVISLVLLMSISFED